MSGKTGDSDNVHAPTTGKENEQLNIQQAGIHRLGGDYRAIDNCFLGTLTIPILRS